MFGEEVDVVTAAFHTHGLDWRLAELFVDSLIFTQRLWRREIDTRVRAVG